MGRGGNSRRRLKTFSLFQNTANDFCLPAWIKHTLFCEKLHFDTEYNSELEVYAERFISSQKTIRESYIYLKLTYSCQSQL